MSCWLPMSSSWKIGRIWVRLNGNLLLLMRYVSESDERRDADGRLIDWRIASRNCTRLCRVFIPLLGCWSPVPLYRTMSRVRNPNFAKDVADHQNYSPWCISSCPKSVCSPNCGTFKLTNSPIGQRLRLEWCRSRSKDQRSTWESRDAHASSTKEGCCQGDAFKVGEDLEGRNVIYADALL